MRELDFAINKLSHMQFVSDLRGTQFQLNSSKRKTERELAAGRTVKLHPYFFYVLFQYDSTTKEQGNSYLLRG
jgi:hypothetical protein